MTEDQVYWKGKCELCKYSKGFQVSSCVWECVKFDALMFAVGKKCPGSICYPKDHQEDLKDEKL